MRFLLCALAALDAAVATAGPVGYTDIRTVNVDSSSLVYDPVSRLLYASTPNGITTINPSTGAVGATYSIGSTPGQLEVGASGGVVYSVTSSSVVAFNTTTNTASAPITFGSAYQPVAFAVSPTNSNVFAVATNNPSVSPGTSGIYIYNNGVQTAAQPTYAASSLTFGSTGSTLYSYNDFTSAWSFATYSVGANSLTAVSSQATAITGVDGLTYNTGRIFSDNGVTLNAATESFLGLFDQGDLGSGSTSALVDGVNGRGYGLFYYGVYEAWSIDFLTVNNNPNSLSDTFLERVIFPSGTGVSSMTEYGNPASGVNGLAVDVGGDQVWLFDAPAVPEPSEVLLTGLALTALAIFRLRRHLATVVA